MEQRARAAPQARMSPAPPRRRRLRLPIAIGGAVMAAAVVAAFAVAGLGGAGTGPGTVPDTSDGPGSSSRPYLRPVSAAQVLENAAWSAGKEKWTDPAPQQFMYVETREMRNQPGYERGHPNGVLVPGEARYRKVQQWQRIDGQVMASMRNGRLAVETPGRNDVNRTAAGWSTLAGLTTPEKVAAWVAEAGPGAIRPERLAGQCALPPDVKAALLRYLAEQPGMTVDPDAVNIDGRPAIGLGRVVEGYRSQELLFDKETYALIGDREIAVADHLSRGADGTTAIHQGDLFRQVIYSKLVVVDRPGDTG
jgi:hypothetical protein